MRRDLVVFGEPTLQKALRTVGSLWQAQSGTRVNVFVAPTDLSYAQIERGVRCDLIFALAGAITETAARAKIIDAGTVRPVLRNSLVLIGPHSGQAVIANATLADIVRLIGGNRLAIANPDREPAGAQAIDLLHDIGFIVDDSNRAIVVAESSAGVVSFLATGKAGLGIVYSTDARPGSVKAFLPTKDQPPIEYVVARARDPQLDPQPFLEFLKSTAATAAFKAAGLSPIEDDGLWGRGDHSHSHDASSQ
jgi:molybdate transport system substrate-binding protein